MKKCFFLFIVLAGLLVLIYPGSARAATPQNPAGGSCISRYGNSNDYNQIVNSGGEQPVAPDWLKGLVGNTLATVSQCTIGFAWTNGDFTQGFLAAYVHSNNGYINKTADDVSLTITREDAGYSFGSRNVNLGAIGAGQSKAGSFGMSFDTATLAEGNNQRCFFYDLVARYGSQTVTSRNGSYCNTWFKPAPQPEKGKIVFTKYGTNSTQAEACLQVIFAVVGCMGTRTQATFENMPILSNGFNYNANATASSNWKIDKIRINQYGANSQLITSYDVPGGFADPVPLVNNGTTYVDIYYSNIPAPSLSSNCFSDTIYLKGTGLPASAALVDVYLDSVANSSLVGGSRYQRVPVINGSFTAEFPQTVLAKNPPTYQLYAYPIDSANRGGSLLPGAPVSVNCPPPPQAEFYPWLQTKEGDVYSRKAIQGQEHFEPGARIGNQFAEILSGSAIATQTNPIVFTGSPPSLVVEDALSANPEKKSLRLPTTGSKAVLGLSGASRRITSVIARIRQETFSADTERANYTIRLLKNGNEVSRKSGSVGKEYTYDGIEFFRYDNDSVFSAAPFGDQFSLEVEFTNDAFTLGQDRNLLVDQMIYYGDASSGPEATYGLFSAVPTGSVGSKTFCSLHWYVVGSAVPANQCDAGGYKFNTPNAGVLAQVSGNLTGLGTGSRLPNGTCDTGVVSRGIGPADLADVSKGCKKGTVYKMQTGNQSLGTMNVTKGRATIWVKGDLRITGNIINSYTSVYASPADLPSLAIYVEGGSISIDSTVSRIDALIISKDKEIRTCATSDTTAATCGSQLRVNGYLASLGKIDFGRRFFSWNLSNQNPAELLTLSAHGVAFPPPGLDSSQGEINSQLKFRSGELSPRLN